MSEQVSAPLRALAQQRARHRCEYCLIHEEDALYPHQPDHIIARKHGGETHEKNLAWACFLCNRLKGSDLASVDVETGQVVRLFNPRVDAWSERFQLLKDGLILPLSAEGRVTEYLLKLNLPENVTERRNLRSVGRYPRE
jgi:5-methylcytosine-specific restriction endonuclease McrA